MMDPSYNTTGALSGVAEHKFGSDVGWHSGDPHMNGLSLQEMIDTDIKAEFDDVLRGTNPLDFQPVDSLELLNDLDALDQGPFKFEASSTSGVTNGVWGAAANGATAHHDYISSALNTNYFEDLNSANNVMVNPSSVMPVTTLHHSAAAQQSSHGQHSPSPRQASGLSVAVSGFSSSVGTAHSPGGPVSLGSPTVYSGGGGQSVQLGVYSQHTSVGGGPIRKTLKVLPPVTSPMQRVPSPGGAAAAQPHASGHHATAVMAVAGGGAGNGAQSPANRKKPHDGKEKENGFPKPAYSYSCLIALALKNSQTGSMSVSEIYKFMCDHFPYFKTAPSGWKNSVRHNLSLSECFEKIEKPSANGNQRKGCLWAMNPAKITKMDEEVQKWSRKDPHAIKKGMAMPDTLESLERGELVRDYNSNTTSSTSPSHSEDLDDEPRTPTSVSSQGSQGYDSAGSDFIDIEGFSTNCIPDSSLNELNIQATGGIYEELGDDRLASLSTTPSSSSSVATTADLLFTTGDDQTFYPSPAAPAVVHANYHITTVDHHSKPTAAAAAFTAITTGAGGERQAKIVIHQKQEGNSKKYYSVP